jgi:hypothetical protein
VVFKEEAQQKHEHYTDTTPTTTPTATPPLLYIVVVSAAHIYILYTHTEQREQKKLTADKSSIVCMAEACVY